MTDGNPKTIFGLAKPGMRAVPPLALLAVGQAMTVGMQKYGHFNWRNEPVTASVYYDAVMRHLLAWWDGQDLDTETGREHLALAAANLLILLDADSGSWLNDDRHSIAGFTNEFIADNTKKMEPTNG